MTRLTRRDWLFTGAAAVAAAPLSSYAVLMPTPGAAAPSGSAKLDANENPYGPAESARRVMAAEVARGNRYVELVGGTAALVSAIAAREGVTPECITLGAGSTEILHMLALAFGLGGGEVLTAEPTFGLLALFVERAGGRVRLVPLDAGAAHDLDAMARQTTSATSLVYVCNPNNPTGTLLPPAKLRAFCEEVSKRATVVVDEAYIEYVDPAERVSAVEHVRAGANVIVVRTFSKLYGLAGMRVGYAIGRPDLVERLVRFRTGNLNRVGVAAAIATYEDREFAESSRRRNAEARAHTVSGLAEMGVRCAPSHTNFLFADVGQAGRALPAALAARGVRVNAAGVPLASDQMRVTVGTMDEMQRFLAAMREARRS